MADKNNQTPIPESKPVVAVKTDTVFESGATKPHPAKLKAAWEWVRAKRWRQIVAAIVTTLAVAVPVVSATSLRYVVAAPFWRTTAGFKIIDSLSQQAVPGAQVKLGSKTATSDQNGIVRFSKTKPGKASVGITKTGYFDLSQNRTIGFKHQPDQVVVLKPNGIKIIVQATNKITAQKLAGVTVKIGDASAVTVVRR